MTGVHDAYLQLLTSGQPTAEEVAGVAAVLVDGGFARTLLPAQQVAVTRLVRAEGDGNFSAPGSGKTTMTVPASDVARGDLQKGGQAAADSRSGPILVILNAVIQEGARHELRIDSRPEFEVGDDVLTIVDLFAGCGGLTLGAAQAARAAGLALDVRLAVDLEVAATEVYAENFRKARVETASVDDFFDGPLRASLTKLEVETREAVGQLDLLVGGPPCQGHSNLNNHTRRDDPKNALYARMARAAEVLEPTFVIVENVPSVRHDISDVVGTTRLHLERAGYAVAEATVPLHPLGVAQRRKRHVLLASRAVSGDPAGILEELTRREPDGTHTLRWAIEDLMAASPVGLDAPPGASAENQRRMKYLLAEGAYDLPNAERPRCHQGTHSYKSMYGRLRWDLPAQTITSGFGSIGQGRYMHPELARALTPHEAARIQGFPDYFSFAGVRRRADLATMIGNAVPPVLAREVVAGLLESTAARHRHHVVASDAARTS